MFFYAHSNSHFCAWETILPTWADVLLMYVKGSCQVKKIREKLGSGWVVGAIILMSTSILLVYILYGYV